MNIWILVVIFGVTGFGAGGRDRVEYPDKESCYEALNSMRITGQRQTRGEDDEQVIAFCYPEKVKR